jgi:hypothetical protein
MGSLKPGASYTYERVGDTVYARESGQIERHPVGWEFEQSMHQKAFENSIQPYVNKGKGSEYDPRTPDGRPLRDHILEDKMWGEIRRMAPTNPALQKALDRAIMIYRLSKDKPL